MRVVHRALPALPLAVACWRRRSSVLEAADVGPPWHFTSSGGHRDRLARPGLAALLAPLARVGVAVVPPDLVAVDEGAPSHPPQVTSPAPAASSSSVPQPGARVSRSRKAQPSV